MMSDAFVWITVVFCMWHGFGFRLEAKALGTGEFLFTVYGKSRVITVGYFELQKWDSDK